MGFLVSQHGQLGAIPPPPFWAFPPWRACEVEVRYPPPQNGVSQQYLRDTLWKQGTWVRYSPLRCYLEKILREMWGGVCRTGPLRWALPTLRLAALWMEPREASLESIGRLSDLHKGSAERRFPELFWFLLKTNGRSRSKSEQIGAFPKTIPKGPKIEKIQDRPPGLKFSIEIENFKRATQQTPIFCGEFWRSGLKFSIEIEIFKRDWNFHSRLNFFNLWALRVRVILILIFSIFGP